MTEEFFWGTCDSCHKDGLVHRVFIEAGEYSGTSAPRCQYCRENVPTNTTLEDPPQDKGARPPSRRRRKVVDRQERETAAQIGGYKQAASGSMPSAKGDVRRKGALRGEMKSTEKGSFIIKRSVLDKIRGECVGAEKPFVTVRFIHPITMATEDEWVLIPIEHWEHNKNATP